MSNEFTPMPPPPSGPPAGYGAPEARTAPTTVVNAVRLMFLIAALGVVSIIVVFADKSALRTAIEKNDSTLSGSDVDHAVNLAITIGAVIAVIIVVLYVLLALQVRKGKNWARITTWVLSALGALGAISNLAQPQAALTKVLAGIELIIYVVLIVLLALHPSGEYFQRRRAPYGY